MRKKILVIIAAVVVMTTSIACASPLTDYSAGKIAIDLTWRQSEVNGMEHGVGPDSWNLSFGHKYNLDGSITAGLGNNFAIQYNIYNADSKDVPYQNVTGHGKLNTRQFNVLYKLDSSLSVYAGVMNTQCINSGSFGTLSTSTQNKWQIGLVGSTKIGAKTTAFAGVGIGKDLNTWQVGVSQEIAPNLEFNVDYRYVDAKKLIGNDYHNNVDVTAKGWGLGVTYKF